MSLYFSRNNILITDINPTDGRSNAEALFCISELTAYNNTVQQGNWYLNNNTILDDKGWEIDQRTFDGFQTVTLRRVSVWNAVRDKNTSARMRV